MAQVTEVEPAPDGEPIRVPASGAEPKAYTPWGLPVVRSSDFASFMEVHPGARPTQFDFNRPLIPLEVGTSPEDRPTRACDKCGETLPELLGERSYYTVGVIGVNNASKSSFIGTSLHEAYEEDGLSIIGCTEFEPDGQTADRFYETYEKQLYLDQTAFHATEQASSFRDLRPLIFRTRFDPHAPSLLVIHDLAGEDLSKWDKRPRVARFLQKVDAIICIIDPRWLHKSGLAGDASAGFNQSAVLGQILEERRDSQVPLAVVIGKSDLLLDLDFARAASFHEDAPDEIGAWEQDRELVDREVRATLAALGGKPLLRTAERHSNTSFHAVTALGKAVDDGKPIGGPPKPTRVLDPWIWVIRSIPGLGRS